MISARRFAGGSNIILLGQGTAPSGGGGGSVAPSAPQGVSALAGDGQASVIFSAPSSNGGAAITGYTVTSIPAGGTDSNAGSLTLTHVVTGLTNGVAYAFTVAAANSVGTGQSSAPTTPVTPQAAIGVSSQWTPVAPTHTSWTPVS